MWELMQSLDATTDAGRAQIATLLRLSDASAAYYDQIDAFNKTLGIGQESDLNAQLKSIRDAAVGLVKALSAAGASTDTLQKVYTAAINKEQEVIGALQESAQELAFSLGLTTKGSLSQVNQEISDLESKANSGASAVSGFGSAIHEASQKANDAINLLLGNLSPLNDQQKLQTALNGLRAGTVTADQVLEIGRRLYASSEAYTSLFNTVKGYAGKGGTTGGSSFSGGNSSTSSGGLTPEEQARLQQLLAQQQTLQAAQTLSQYQTLAQQIAEIASAKQESWQDVLKEMDIQSSDLEKGLGLANDDALDAYLTNIQKQTDSATENTQSIVDAILALPTQIAAALSGALPADGSTGPNHVTIPTIGGSTPSTPPGTGNNGTTPIGGSGGTGGGGNGGGGTGPIHLSPESATMVGNAVVIGMQPTVNGIMNLPSRNLRMPASVR
jgi:cell division septum initiation protein DivIVA